MTIILREHEVIGLDILLMLKSNAKQPPTEDVAFVNSKSYVHYKTNLGGTQCH